MHNFTILVKLTLYLTLGVISLSVTYNRSIKFNRSNSPSISEFSNRFNSMMIYRRCGNLRFRSNRRFRHNASIHSASARSIKIWSWCMEEFKTGILSTFVKFISEGRNDTGEDIYKLYELKATTGMENRKRTFMHRIQHSSGKFTRSRFSHNRYDGNWLIFTRGNFKRPIFSDAVSGLLTTYKFVSRASELSWIMYGSNSTILTLRLKRAEDSSRIGEMRRKWDQRKIIICDRIVLSIVILADICILANQLSL